MDKEIEELLRSLGIEAPCDRMSSCRPSLVSQTSETVSEPMVPEKFIPKASISFGSFVLFFLLACLAGYVAFFGGRWFTQKPPTVAVRIVEPAQFFEASFCRTCFKMHRTVTQWTSFELASQKFDAAKDESVLAYDPQSFLYLPQQQEKVLISQILSLKESSLRAKKGIGALLDQIGPLADREHLRSLFKGIESYVRTQLVNSAFLENTMAKEGGVPCLETTPFGLYMTLHGGVPLLGCKEVVRTAEKIQKEFESLLFSFKQTSCIDEQAMLALRMSALIEKVSQDRLLACLIDGKEEKKKLDACVQASLTGFNSQKTMHILQSIKVLRAVCFLESCLSKKEVDSWKTFEERFPSLPPKAYLEQRNSLSSDPSLQQASKMVWTSFLSDAFYALAPNE